MLFLSGTGVSTEFFKNSNGVFPNSDGPYQMEVALGTAPEPSVFVLTTAGFGILLAFAYRKKRIIPVTRRSE